MPKGLLFKSCLPGHLRKQNTFRGQVLIVLANAIVAPFIHAYDDHALAGRHHAFLPTYNKSARSTGGTMHPTYINGAKNVKHFNVEKTFTTDHN